MSKKVLEQTACPREDCGSSDAFTVYLQDDGSVDAWCFSCNRYFPDPKGDQAKGQTIRSDSDQDQADAHLKDHSEALREALDHPIRELKERGISYSTAEKFGVRVGVDTRDGVSPTYYLFPVHRNGDLTGFFKKSISPKTYSTIGDCSQSDVFGLHVAPAKGKKIFITEGVEDCLSVYQVLKENSTINWEPAVLALYGAGKYNKLADYIDYLESFEEIVFVLDNDAAGREAAEKAAKMFAGKSYIVKLPFKDPNEMLTSGYGEQLKWAILTGAKKYQPDGIVNAKDMWDRYSSTENIEYYSLPDSMPGLNEKIYGLKPGTVMTVTGGTSIGKTQFLRELKHHYLTSTDLKIADIELEADITETLKAIVGLEINKRITLPDVQADKEEEYEAFNNLFCTDRYTLYDYFGGMDDDSLFSKLRYFAATGHNILFLDHLSIVVSEYASKGGERERIDTIMTKLAKLAKETNICIVLVVHLKYSSQDGRSFELGAKPTLDDLRGSASIKQLSWDIIGISRNTQHPDPECAKISELSVLKCRLTGRTGTAGYIKFDETTGHYFSVQPPPNFDIKASKEN